MRARFIQAKYARVIPMSNPTLVVDANIFLSEKGLALLRSLISVGWVIIVPSPIAGEISSQKKGSEESSRAASRALDFILEYRHGCRLTRKAESDAIKRSGLIDPEFKNDAWIKATVLFFKRESPSFPVYGLSLDKDVIVHLQAEEQSLLLTDQEVPDQALDLFVTLCRHRSCGHTVRTILLSPQTEYASRTESRVQTPKMSSSSAAAIATKTATATETENATDNIPLFQWAANGQLTQLKTVLEGPKVVNPDVRATSGVYMGYTLLLVAAWKGQLEVVQFLLNKGCTPLLTCPKGETPEVKARKKQHFDVVNLLVILRPAPPSEWFQMSANGCVDKLQAEMEGNPAVNIDKTNETGVFRGYTMLHRAVLARKIEMVALLLERGCSIFPQTQGGETAAQIAQRKGYKDVSQLFSSTTD